MFRWTNKELKESSTRFLITSFLNERRGSVTNVHAPLNVEIKKVQAWVEEHVPDTRAHDGEQPPANDATLRLLVRIVEKLERGNLIGYHKLRNEDLVELGRLTIEARDIIAASKGV
jgi:hypothetical protein